jgi:hypothetical protein
VKYADKQEIRSQIEGGVDYGYGKRRVLVRNKHKSFLRQEGHLNWSGIGCPRSYTPVTWSLWDSTDSHPECRVEIHEGKMPPEKLLELSPQIFKHLGMTFDLALIRTDRTLLLHEPGELTPEPRKRKPPTPSPKLDVPSVYKVGLRYDADDQQRVKLLIFDVVEQRRGVASLQSRLNSRYCQDVRVDKLNAEGFYTTTEAALAAFLKAQDDDVAEAERALRRKQKQFADAVEERDRIVALARRDLPEIPFPVDTPLPVADVAGPYTVQVRYWDDSIDDWASTGLVQVTAQNAEDAKKQALKLAEDPQIERWSARILITPDDAENEIPTEICRDKEWHGTRISPGNPGTCFYCGEPVEDVSSLQPTS